MSWLATAEMSEKYGLNLASLYTFAHTYKETNYVKKDGKNTYYNVKELMKIRKEHERVWNACHEYYYFMTIDAKLSDSEQARLLIEDTQVGTIYSWADFFTYGLWGLIHDVSILSIGMRRTKIEAYCRWCEDSIPKIQRSIKLGKWKKLND